MVMNRWLIGAVLLAPMWMPAMGQAVAQGPGTSDKPLDLSVPRHAGQWTDLAVRSVPLEPAPAASSPVRPTDAAARVRSQPYGTGYEARMSPAAAAMGSPGRGAGSPPAASPRGRGR